MADGILLIRSHAGARFTKIVLVVLVTAIVAAYFVFPVLWIIVASTKDTAALLGTGILQIPRRIVFIHNIAFLSLFQKSIYWHWYANSIFYSAAVGLLTCLVSSMAAYPLAKQTFQGRESVFRVIIISLMIPGTVIAVPLFMLEKVMGLVDTYLGVILPMTVSPFGVYFLRIYIRDVIPDEVLDAALVEGGSQWLIYSRVIVPMIRPALTTLLLISFTATWNNFFLPLVLLHNARLYPLTLGIDTWLSLINSVQASEAPWYPLIITGCLLSIAPMIIGFTVLRKAIVTGLTEGAIKL